MAVISLRYFLTMIGVLLLSIVLIPVIILVEILLMTIDFFSIFIGLILSVFSFNFMPDKLRLKVESLMVMYVKWLDKIHDRSIDALDEDYSKYPTPEELER